MAKGAEIPSVSPGESLFCADKTNPGGFVPVGLFVILLPVVAVVLAPEIAFPTKVAVKVRVMPSLSTYPLVWEAARGAVWLTSPVVVPGRSYLHVSVRNEMVVSA
jgi:hypothetical protein